MNINRSALRIVVVGAGIGGLTTALSLLQRGFEVQVFEQASALGEVGAGLQLSANATRALFQLGLEESLKRVAAVPHGKCIRLWNTGQRWKLFDLGQESVRRYGYPYLTVYRPDLHAILVAAVRREQRGSVRLGARCVSVHESADAVSIELANGDRIEADVVIGADGVHSTVRRCLFGEDEARFSGCVAWRGVIDAQRLPDHLREPIGVNWVGPGAHVIQYPLRGGDLVNFVGILERDDWSTESWTQSGTVDECVRDFAGWHDDVHSLIRALVTPFKWGLFLREPMKCWAKGRFALLGDACHPTLPFLAQGAAMAIEDGYVLGRILTQFQDDLPAALQRYQAARIDRTNKIVMRSAENAQRFHNPTLASAEGAAAYVAEEWREELVRERYEWLFTYDVDTAPI